MAPVARWMPTTMTPNRWRRLASMIERPASAGSLLDLHLLHVEIEIVGTGRQLDEVDDGRPQRRLRELQSADLIGGQHTIRSGPDQLRLGVLGLRTSDDEEIGAQQPRRQDRKHIVRVGADRRDEPASAADADAPEHVFAAGVGLDREITRRQSLPACDRHRVRQSRTGCSDARIRGPRSDRSGRTRR